MTNEDEITSALNIYAIIKQKGDSSFKDMIIDRFSAERAENVNCVGIVTEHDQVFGSWVQQVRFLHDGKNGEGFEVEYHIFRWVMQQIRLISGLHVCKVKAHHQ